MPAADAERIFELFARGSNVAQRRGLGLGLYIASELVDLMEGVIGFTASMSGPDAGTCFTVEIPVR